MNPEQENFEPLRRLLALKRHEQPPPGYFDHFAQQVIARIRAAELAAADPVRGEVSFEIPWLQRLWSALENRPIVAGAFGLGVCALLVSGILYSERTEPVAVTILPGAEPTDRPMQVADRPGSLLLEGALATSLSSTGGVMSGQLRDSLFREIRQDPPQLINATRPNY